MTMTKKDYIAIAEMVREADVKGMVAGKAVGDEWDGEAAFKHLVNHLVGYMASDNPRFDHDRFKEAAGIWWRI